MTFSNKLNIHIFYYSGMDIVREYKLTVTTNAAGESKTTIEPIYRPIKYLNCDFTGTVDVNGAPISGTLYNLDWTLTGEWTDKICKGCYSTANYDAHGTFDFTNVTSMLSLPKKCFAGNLYVINDTLIDSIRINKLSNNTFGIFANNNTITGEADFERYPLIMITGKITNTSTVGTFLIDAYNNTITCIEARATIANKIYKFDGVRYSISGVNYSYNGKCIVNPHYNEGIESYYIHGEGVEENGNITYYGTWIRGRKNGIFKVHSETKLIKVVYDNDNIVDIL